MQAVFSYDGRIFHFDIRVSAVARIRFYELSSMDNLDPFYVNPDMVILCLCQ